MVRIAISEAAFDAIAKMLALGSTGYENAINEKGSAWSGWTVRLSIGSAPFAARVRAIATLF
jgi:hypothetical protein